MTEHSTIRRATAELHGTFLPPDAFVRMIVEMQAETRLRPSIDVALERGSSDRKLCWVAEG
jgi:hypothetical protein